MADVGQFAKFFNAYGIRGVVPDELDGMLAAMHVLAALGGQDKPLSQMLASYSRHVASGDINGGVTDQAAAAQQVRKAFETRSGVSSEDPDGVTVTGDHWWFSPRPSNTQPLLRLNVEASDNATLAALHDEVPGIGRGD